MTSRTASRCVAFFLSLATVSATTASAFAQSDSEDGIVRIVVEDDAKHPLGNARVFLLGPNTASALTNKTGVVKYTDVQVGIYRIRIVRPGYLGVTSRSFEVLGNKQVDVTVDLGTPNNPTAAAAADNATQNSSSSNLKVIGTTRARVVVSTSDVDDSSPVRRISDSLADALNTLAGVDVTTASNDPDAAQTISLHGHDESQTAVTLDGIPLGAPGTAVNLRGINLDLFTGASASFGAKAGALGGSVNFSTLQPTQSWQERVTAADGSFDKYNWSIGETGSIGKLGIAVMTTKRGGNNPLTFRDFEDESGLTYPHGGESTSAGDMVKLRYELTDTTTLVYTALENNTDVASLCTQFTGPLPCGIGPNNGTTGKYFFNYLTVQQLVGQIAVQATGFTSSSYSLTNDLNRYIEGVPDPYATQSNTLARGIAAQATVAKDNHTITLNAATFSATTTFTPLVEEGPSAFQLGSLNGVSSGTYSLTDSIKLSDKVSIGPQLSLAETTGSGTSILGGFAGSWRPDDHDTFTAQSSIGSSQPAPAIQRSYSDPDSARTNCYAGTAQVSGPGDQPTKQSAIDYEATWSHQWSSGAVLNVDTYRQSQAGQLVNAAITAAAAGLDPTNPYYGAILGYYSSVCPTSPIPTVYVSEPVNDTTRIYQGYDITGRFGLGRDFTVIPSYSTNSSFYAAADPRFTGVGSTLVLFEQIYGRPLHKANLTLDAFHPPSGFEFLANAQYAGINNSQHLAPYVSVSLGISHAFGSGQLTLFETNAFNTETGYFSTLAYAEPEPIVGGAPLLVAANPLPPRTIQLSYSLNTGARSGAGGAHIPGMRGGGAGRQVAQAGPSPSPGPGGRGLLGFGELHFIAPPDGTDPLAVATARTECTAELQPIAQQVLSGIGAAAKAFAGGATTLPTVTGITITPHGSPSGAWWFGLGPEIPQNLIRRPQGQGETRGGGRRGGGLGGPGGRGEEGPPGGFQPEVTVGPNANENAPRPQFSPSPELIAALQPFRALVSCAYGTVLTPAEATAKGLDVGTGGPGGPQPGASPVPSPTPAPGASPGPGEGRGRNGARGRGFLQYAPNVGIFVVRAPQLGTGGGSVKQ
jgi:hypothetical protein